MEMLHNNYWNGIRQVTNVQYRKKKKIHLIIFLCEICRKIFHPIEFVPKDFISRVSNFHSRNNCIFLDRVHKFYLLLCV